MAEKEAGSVVVAIRATAENLEQVAEEAKAKLQGIGTAADKTKKPMEESGKAGKDAGKDISAGAQEAQLAWLALAAVAVTAFRKMREAVNQGVADTNAYKDALRGLSSVADYAGVSQGAIEEATAKVTNEFFNAEAAATSLKNLLLRGFSLDQAVNTIQRLQDSAAYGRQASLTLSDAVKSATEGLKNENSILVDNAGVTKNVAKMWEDYAKKRGISTAAMTQAQRVEAEYLGIQQETAAMTGDLASLQDTLSGKMAKAENQAYLLSKALGEANTQLKAAETDLKNGLLQGLTELVQTFPGVTAGATTATGAFVGMMAAVPVLKKVVELWKSLQVTIKTAKVSMGTLGWVALGLGAVTTAFTAYKNHLEKVAQEEEKRIQQNKDAVKAQQDRIDTMKALINRYVELKRKQSITYREAVELTGVENDLAAQYGLTKDQLDKLIGSTDDYAESLSNLTAAELEELMVKQKQTASDSWTSADSEMKAAFKQYQEQLDFINNWYGTYGKEKTDDNFMYFLPIAPEELTRLDEYKENLKTALSSVTDALTNEMSYYETQATLLGREWSSVVSDALVNSLVLNIDPSQFDTFDALKQYLMQQTFSISEIASNPALTSAIDTMQDIYDQMSAGESGIDLSGMENAVKKIDDAWYVIRDVIPITREQFVSLVSPIDYLIGDMDALTESILAQAAANRDAMFYAQATQNMTSGLATTLGEAGARYDKLLESVQAYQEELADHAKEAEAIATWQRLGGELEELTKGSDEYTAKLREMQQAALDLNLSFDGTEAGLDYTNQDVEAKANGLIEATEVYAETRRELMAAVRELMSLGPGVLIDDAITSLIALYRVLGASSGEIRGLEAFGNFFDEYQEQFDEGLDALKEKITAELGNWNEDLAGQLSLVFRYALTNLGIEDPELGTEIASSLIGIIGDAISDGETAALFETLSEFTEHVMQGITPDDEALELANEAWGQLFGADGFITQKLSELGFSTESIDGFKEALFSIYDPLTIFGEGLEASREAARSAANGYADVEDKISDTEKALRDYRKTLKGMQRDLKSTTAMTQNIKQWKDLYAAYKEAKKNGKDTSKTIKDMTPLIKKMIGSFDGSEQAIEDTNDAFGRLADYVPQRIAELESNIASLEKELWALDATDPSVEVKADIAALLAAIATSKQELLDLLELMAEAGIVSSGGGGGGGGRKHAPSGGGGPSQSAYDKEIDHLEHLKALDQLTYEQELENLEDISRRRIADAEERLDLEEHIFDVKKSIAERDAENLTDLTEAIMDALEERYDSMREAELETLEQSRNAWEEWRDHNVSAIQEQIDALDALEEAEDNEADRQEHLRKIAMLEQNLAYEQDTYNQMQLQKKLDAAREDYDDFLSDLEREEQKAALEAAMDEINQKADSEIDALDQQQEAVEAYYDARMEQANLQAEAELALLNSTQQQIIDLLTAYAPDYDAAGRTLGEKLMEGFTSVVGTFNDWFSDFESKVTTAVDSLQAANKAAASGREQTYDEYGNPVSGITIEQTNNFNTPVETPAETARRIQQANEDLAEQIAGE